LFHVEHDFGVMPFYEAFRAAFALNNADLEFLNFLKFAPRVQIKRLWIED